MVLLRLILSGLLFTFLGCRTLQSESDLLLTNAREDLTGDFAPVFRIAADVPGQDKSKACGATAVGPNTALTAGHCVRSGTIKLRNIRIIDGDNGLVGKTPKEVITHKDYSETRETVRRDITVLIFDGQPFREAYTSFGQTAPTKGKRVTIVGYGKQDHDDDDSSGGRHFGVNDVSSVSADSDRNTINFLGHPHYVGESEDGKPVYVDYQDTDRHTQAGINVGASHGDSGGPMLFDGLIVGVASSVDKELSQEGLIHAHYENLNGPSVKEFLTGTRTKGAYISGLHPNPKGNGGFEKRRLVTPRDLEKAIFDNTAIDPNENYQGGRGRELLGIRCVCQQTATDCTLKVVDKDGTEIMEYANDAAAACGDGSKEACRKNFEQYRSQCKRITTD